MRKSNVNSLKLLASATLAALLASTSAVADPPTPPTGTSFADRSALLAGYVPDSIPVPFSGDGMGGIGWFDYQNDGDLDLFVPNGKGAPNALYRNDGDGTFTDVAAAAGVDSTTGYSGVVIGDIDNDGHDDILLSGEGFFLLVEASPVTLYHNNGDGTFTDITMSAGVMGAETALSSVMADFNNDGYLDIFMTAPGHIGFLALQGVPYVPPSEAHKNVLYLNNGDLTFAELGAAAGVDGDQGACTAAATDYDNDGWMDLVVGNCNAFTPIGTPRPGPINLYRNNGNLTFTDVAATAGINAIGFWMSVTPGDYDNDGDIDIMSTSLGGVVVGPGNVFPHVFYRNNGDGTYTNIAAALGLALVEFSWGASFLDADNDGDLDLYFVGSLPLFNFVGPGRANPGRLFMNDGDGTFSEADQADTGGSFESLSIAGAARGDYDGDGNIDLALNNRSLTMINQQTGQPQQIITGQPILLRNEGSGGLALRLRLVATGGGPAAAIGARVELRTGSDRQVREVRAGSSCCSTESPWLHFGLGLRDAADVQVRWPSGRVEEFDDLPAGSLVTLVEGDGKSDDD